MAIQTILNGVHVISLGDVKYLVNNYSDGGGQRLEVVRLSDLKVIVVIYAGITHWVVTPVPAKFNKTKNTGIEITLD